MRRSGFVSALVLTQLVLAAGCGDRAAEPAAIPATLTVAQPAPTLQVGQTLQLAPVVKDSRGATMSNARVHYTSDAPDIVSVDSTGLLTAKAVGTAHVTALAHPAIATVTVTVEPVGGVQPAALSLELTGDRVIRVSTWQLLATSIPIRAVNAAGTDLCGIAPVSVRADSAIVTAVVQRVGNGACVVRVIPRADGATWLVVRTGSLVDSAQVIATTKMRYIWSFTPERSNPVGPKVVGSTVRYLFDVFGEDGRPVSGVTLILNPTNGSVAKYSLTSDSSGRASVAWVMPIVLYSSKQTTYLSFHGTLPDGNEIISNVSEEVVPDVPAEYRVLITRMLRTYDDGCLAVREFHVVRAGSVTTFVVESGARPGPCVATMRFDVVDRFGNSRADLLQLVEASSSAVKRSSEGPFYADLDSAVSATFEAAPWLAPVQLHIISVTPPRPPPPPCIPNPEKSCCPPGAMCPPPCYFPNFCDEGTAGLPRGDVHPGSHDGSKRWLRDQVPTGERGRGAGLRGQVGAPVTSSARSR